MQARYKKLQRELEGTQYYALKTPVYSTMPSDMSNSAYDFDAQGELQKLYAQNPDIKKKAEEMEKLFRIFGLDVRAPMKAKNNSQNNNHSQNNSHSVNYNDGNWHPHPEIADVQIRRSEKRQEARGNSVRMNQSGNNQTQFINNVEIR